jgi:gamma-glutamylcyclotransferase (GGCT)/AIG2-like uncharacterized protein YtfP
MSTRQRHSARTVTPQLFVYGTLMRGHGLHRDLARLPGIRYVGKARIRAKLYKLPGRDYPAAVPSLKENQFVQGELYSLSDPHKTLRVLDQLEEVDEGLFRRRRTDVWLNGKKTSAWSYFYARPLNGAKLIPAGKFVKNSAVPKR